uniref:Membrane insertase YidC/Oxa/ALB C-terminal domain-containing protein n=1 Tax=Setaria digitata TaxID=48799 RepID=A0A915PKK1_9BILA
MSIYTIPCRIVARRLGGTVASTSSGIIFSSNSLNRWQNLGDVRSFSDNIFSTFAKELQALPVVQWFDQSIKALCGSAQNLIEDSGLNSTSLEQLGLYIWWKPSSWYRVMLEILHTNYDLSWLGAIICGIRSRVGSAILYSSSAGLLLTQYCGIKKMAEVVYPNWAVSGVLSFTDLTVPDPAYLLPMVTAISFTFTSKKWIEILQIQKTVSNWMLGIKPSNTIYPIAACSFFVASNVPAAICVYWITSSLISGMHTTILGTRTMRSLLHLPSSCLDPVELRRMEFLNYVTEMRRNRANETSRAAKTTAKTAIQTTGIDKPSESLVIKAKGTEIEGDSLFQEFLGSNAVTADSKIANLMQQQIKEAAQSNAIRKGEKTNSVLRSDSQKFRIDEILVMLRFRQHLLTGSVSFPSILVSPIQNLVVADRFRFISQTRGISFFGGASSSPSSPNAPEILVTSANAPVASNDSADFTLIEQLQLNSVKDFHLFDFLAGNSLVKEYNLFSWWSPASWFRLALEYMHFNVDLPWWLTVICATVSLRLLMIFVPIASHRLMGRVQLYKKEIDEFKGKIESAQRNGNFLETMEAQKEMKDFLKSKDIKLYRQFMIMSLNGAIFMTQFIAVKKLADVAFPGLNTGGLYWFKDLTAPDPYYLLPFFSALTVAAVFKLGAETGGTNQTVNPYMQKVLTRVAPVAVFACSTKVSSAIALYWCTSNLISVVFSGMFKIPSIRTFLKIPQLPLQRPNNKILGQDMTQIIMES